MNLTFLRYRSLDTSLHRLDPRAKLSWALAVTAMSFIFYDVLPLFLILASVVPVVFIARSFNVWARAMAWFSLAAVFIITFNVLLVPGESLASLETPWFTINATIEGLISGIAMSLRLLAVVGAFLIMILTTHPNELSEGLGRMGMPGWASFSLATAFRFVPTIAGDFARVQEAQLSRGLRAEKGLKSRVGSTVPVLIPAFVLSIRRSQLLAEALESRGYLPRSRRTSLHPLHMRPTDWAFAITCILAVVIAAGVRVLCT